MSIIQKIMLVTGFSSADIQDDGNKIVDTLNAQGWALANMAVTESYGMYTAYLTFSYVGNGYVPRV